MRRSYTKGRFERLQNATSLNNALCSKLLWRLQRKDVPDGLSYMVLKKGMGVSVEVILKARQKSFSIKEVSISCHGLGIAFTVPKLHFRNARKRLNLFFTKGAKR